MSTTALKWYYEAMQQTTKELINPMHDPKVLEKRKQKREIRWKANKKHNLFMSNYLTPGTQYFANAYQSALAAGFSKSYSLNITNLAPKWISEYIDKLDFQPEHIKQGIQQLATKQFSEQQSRSPADTNLKAFEILAKITGMIDSKQGTTVNIVQPILNGESVRVTKAQEDKQVIDQ